MRKLPNWLNSFIEYGKTGEAPEHVLFWCGASAIAGALGRKCWVDQENFLIFPNHYVVLVAPPGIISKTSTAKMATAILKKVEGVCFGPTVTTWQALLDYFEKGKSVVSYAPGHYQEVFSLTISSGELGNFVRPDDTEMMDILNTLWDCDDVEKATKKEGIRTLPNPFLNLIACTTPSWISGNFPAYMRDGGLVSRIIWVYADRKRKFVAYPQNGNDLLKSRLFEDLNDIAQMEGRFTLSADALAWGTSWYEKHCRELENADSRLAGWLARRQTHLHKLAMVLSAARSADRFVTAEDLKQANRALDTIRLSLPRVFDRIGKSEASNNSDRLADFIAHAGDRGVTPKEIFNYMHGDIPTRKGIEEAVQMLVQSGLIKATVRDGGQAFVSTVPPTETAD